MRCEKSLGTWGITEGTFVTHGSTHDSSPLVRPRLHGLQLGMKIKYIPKMNKYLVEEK